MKTRGNEMLVYIGKSIGVNSIDMSTPPTTSRRDLRRYIGQYEPKAVEKKFGVNNGMKYPSV